MIHVLVFADIRLYGELLAHVLSESDDVEVVGIITRATELDSKVVELGPDVLVADAGLPETMAALRNLLVSEETEVVAVAVPETEDRITEAAEAGISAYVPCDAGLGDLVAAVQGVVHGEFVCTPRVAAILNRHIANLARERDSRGDSGALTPREREIIKLIDQGCSNKEIALRLSIKVPTVKNHVHNILEKMHVNRRGEAAALLHGRLAHHQ